MIKDYQNGFKTILYTKAALFVLIGIILRWWEEAIVTTYLSDYMKNYTDDAADIQE